MLNQFVENMASMFLLCCFVSPDSEYLQTTAAHMFFLFFRLYLLHIEECSRSSTQTKYLVRLLVGYTLIVQHIYDNSRKNFEASFVTL